MTRRIRAGAPLALCALALAAAGCGEDDFENEPRPPTPKQLTGVITEERVTVSPDEIGAGPIEITVSNQTQMPHTITLESTDGGTIREQSSPINPLDTATIQRTLEPGLYTVSAGSSQAVKLEIQHARLVFVPQRKSGSGDLLLP